MKAQTRRRRILVAEDNPSDVFLIQQALKENEVDAEILVFVDGEAVASYFEKSPTAPAIDLMLLDLHLPKRDGVELLRHLRASGPTEIPVILMSSSSSKSDRREAEQYQADYFVKPTSLDEFMQLGGVVRRALGLPAGDPPAGFFPPLQIPHAKSGR